MRRATKGAAWWDGEECANSDCKQWFTLLNEIVGTSAFPTQHGVEDSSADVTPRLPTECSVTATPGWHLVDGQIDEDDG